MSKPREFWVGQKYEFNGGGTEKVWFASRSREALEDYRGGNKVGSAIHVIEKSAYDELEAKLAKAVEALDSILKLDPFNKDDVAFQALKEIEGSE